MFQSLSQGAIIPILYKNTLDVVNGKVLSVNTHMPKYNPAQPMAVLTGPVTDITVQVDSETIPFVSLPANGVTATFSDKGMFISTDVTAIIRELESIRNTSKQAIDQMPALQERLKKCDEVLLTLQPEKKKEAEQSKEIELLKGQITTMNSKFDKLMDIISGKFSETTKTEE